MRRKESERLQKQIFPKETLSLKVGVAVREVWAVTRLSPSKRVVVEIVLEVPFLGSSSMDLNLIG